MVERQPVVVAALDVPEEPGEDEHLTTKLLEVAWLQDSFFQTEEEIVGKIVTTSLYKDEIVHDSRMAEVGEATLAALIPENNDVAIRVNDVIGVAGFLLPGNEVDILSTVKSGQSYVRNTVLKDIKVLAVDQTAQADDNKPVIVRAVTLEVTPKRPKNC